MPEDPHSPLFKVSKDVAEYTPEIDWETLKSERPDIFKKLAVKRTHYDVNEAALEELFEDPEEASVLQRHLKVKPPSLRVTARRIEQEKDLDEASEAMFGAPFHHLSAWGQKHVVDTLQSFESLSKPKVDVAHNISLPNAENSLRADNEKLARRVEDLEQENEELWRENELLKITLPDLDLS
jgi:hypothetical protein